MQMPSSDHEYLTIKVLIFTTLWCHPQHNASSSACVLFAELDGYSSGNVLSLSGLSGWGHGGLATRGARSGLGLRLLERLAWRYWAPCVSVVAGAPAPLQQELRVIAVTQTSMEMVTLTVPDDPPLSGHGGVVALRLRVARWAEVLLAWPHPLGPRHEVVTRPVQDVGAVAPLQKLLLGSLLLVKVKTEGGDGRVELGVLSSEYPQELRTGQRAQRVRWVWEPATRRLALFTILNYIGFKYQKFSNLKKCNQKLSRDAQPMSEKY